MDANTVAQSLTPEQTEAILATGWGGWLDTKHLARTRPHLTRAVAELIWKELFYWPNASNVDLLRLTAFGQRVADCAHAQQFGTLRGGPAKAPHPSRVTPTSSYFVTGLQPESK